MAGVPGAGVGAQQGPRSLGVGTGPALTTHWHSSVTEQAGRGARGGQ